MQELEAQMSVKNVTTKTIMLETVVPQEKTIAKLIRIREKNENKVN